MLRRHVLQWHPDRAEGRTQAARLAEPFAFWKGFQRHVEAVHVEAAAALVAQQDLVFPVTRPALAAHDRVHWLVRRLKHVRVHLEPAATTAMAMELASFDTVHGIVGDVWGTYGGRWGEGKTGRLTW